MTHRYLTVWDTSGSGVCVSVHEKEGVLSCEIAVSSLEALRMQACKLHVHVDPAEKPEATAVTSHFSHCSHSSWVIDVWCCVRSVVTFFLIQIGLQAAVDLLCQSSSSVCNWSRFSFLCSGVSDGLFSHFILIDFFRGTGSSCHLTLCLVQVGIDNRWIDGDKK